MTKQKTEKYERRNVMIKQRQSEKQTLKGGLKEIELLLFPLYKAHLKGFFLFR